MNSTHILIPAYLSGDFIFRQKSRIFVDKYTKNMTLLQIWENNPQLQTPQEFLATAIKEMEYYEHKTISVNESKQILLKISKYREAIDKLNEQKS